MLHMDAVHMDVNVDPNVDPMEIQMYFVQNDSWTLWEYHQQGSRDTFFTRYILHKSVVFFNKS